MNGKMGVAVVAAVLAGLGGGCGSSHNQAQSCILGLVGNGMRVTENSRCFKPYTSVLFSGWVHRHSIPFDETVACRLRKGSHRLVIYSVVKPQQQGNFGSILCDLLTENLHYRRATS